MYAPTINSYKRLVEGAWAPTTITWGVENRTTALRIINTTENYTRLETRIPGSDTNPYLAMAAALASGLWYQK
jgi:glutamine synthetase